MILEKIIAWKKQEVNLLKDKLPLSKLVARLPYLSPVLSFHHALQKPGEIALIAEIKKASPSKGVIRKDFDPCWIACQYESAGAAAISVLTDEEFFGGHISYLKKVREKVSLPLLRKDFIIDPYQVYESRVFGADAILLIAAVLINGKLKEFMELAAGLGLSCLVEVHTEAELEQALAAGANIIGINNRDLSSFHTELATTFSLLPKIVGRGVVVVSESGIKTCQDMQALLKHGVNAALVGEALMESPDIGKKIRELLGS